MNNSSVHTKAASTRLLLSKSNTGHSFLKKPDASLNDVLWMNETNIELF